MEKIPLLELHKIIQLDLYRGQSILVIGSFCLLIITEIMLISASLRKVASLKRK